MTLDCGCVVRKTTTRTEFNVFVMFNIFVRGILKFYHSTTVLNLKKNLVSFRIFLKLGDGMKELSDDSESFPLITMSQDKK